LRQGLKRFENPTTGIFESHLGVHPWHGKVLDKTGFAYDNFIIGLAKWLARDSSLQNGTLGRVFRTLPRDRSWSQKIKPADLDNLPDSDVQAAVNKILNPEPPDVENENTSSSLEPSLSPIDEKEPVEVVSTPSKSVQDTLMIQKYQQAWTSIRQLTNPDPNYTITSAPYLELLKLDPDLSVPALIQALLEPPTGLGGDARKWAARLLGILGQDNDVRPILTKIVSDRSYPWYIRYEAVRFV